LLNQIVYAVNQMLALRFLPVVDVHSRLDDVLALAVYSGHPVLVVWAGAAPFSRQVW
jgi:hypothetical protein